MTKPPNTSSRPRPPRRVPGVENRPRKHRDGTPYWTFRVRWIDPLTALRCGEEFDSQQDAIDFRAALRLARRSGILADVNAGRETLAEWTDYWWDTYASRNLARNTLLGYAGVWNKHALPRLGALQLRAITPGVVARFRSDLEHAGVGAPTIRKTLAVLQAILRRAVEEDKLTTNPVAQVRKPQTVRARVVRPLAPAAVEAMRDHAELPAATLISVLAYAGLRPEEALALHWRHVGKQTVLVEQKNIDGEIVVGQKVLGKAARTVRLVAALRTDLAAYRLSLGGADDDALVLPRADGGPWRLTDYRNWRRRVFRHIAADAGLATPPRPQPKQVPGKPRPKRVVPWDRDHPYDGPVPYDLRHSFASLLIHAGELSVVEIAAQLGHSTETLLRTYAHVFADLADQPKLPVDVQIAEARGTQARRLG